MAKRAPDIAGDKVGALLAAAAEAQRAGRPDAARRHLEAVLAIAPDQPQALNSLGMQALADGDPARAAKLFAGAAEADPEVAALWLNLAKARRLAGDEAGERASLARVLEIDQLNLMGLIRLAEHHERHGEDAPATRLWTKALAVGRLLDGRSAELDAVLARAAAYVADRGRLFAEAIDRGLEGARRAAEPSDRRRFDACIDHLLGRRAIYANQCQGIHYPFLPADEFFDRRHFPWLDGLEARTDAIRAEADALIREGAGALEPYVALDRGAPSGKWTELDRSLDWGAYHLWRHGERIEEACARCPATAAAIEALPLAHMPRRTPTAFFSVLRPRTRIPPHTGVSNTRAIIHLPLIVPPGCGFRVGGETREWRVGGAFAFDDTIEHEAWNDSDEPRAILIFDVWNPHLGEAERSLLQTFFAAADASGHDPGLGIAISESDQEKGSR